MTGPAEGGQASGGTLELLQSFDGRLQSVASGVARGEYVFWLGSGLSRSVVPDVGELLRQLLSFLQARIDTANEACRFRRALREILEVSGIQEAELEQIQLTTSVDSWPQIDDLVQQLTGRYSSVFGVPVGGEDPDFLLWEGIDVVNTYGSPDLEPAAEHLCLAILMLEGVIRNAASANWDGLVERAIHRLTGEATGFLRVVVLPEEFSEPDSRCDLIKFHGCAVKAREDPWTYRGALIARQFQLSGWATNAQNAVMKGHLEHLVATSGALVVGLSVQDANLHTILHQAAENLGRTRPVTPPAVVFALEDLKQAQRHVLEITYGDGYAEHRDEIEAAALLGAYAQPFLLALVLYTLADKLSSLVTAISPAVIDDATKAALQDGIRDLRDLVAGAADDDSLAFVERLVAGVGVVLSVFRAKVPPDATDCRYEPLTAQPIEQTILDPNRRYGRTRVSCSGGFDAWPRYRRISVGTQGWRPGSARGRCFHHRARIGDITTRIGKITRVLGAGLWCAGSARRASTHRHERCQRAGDSCQGNPTTAGTKPWLSTWADRKATSERSRD